ncbi:hypothetical protein ACGFS9_10850 [Streptomyces sp. NPDC048566]|uniref:hypothetical protein n=1 Tax=Streptomyces sp. NPDC048566 TaxID=3365569 RepID=UPI00371B88D0
MGRVGRNWPRVRIRSHLNWTFSATAAMGRSRPAASRRRSLRGAGLRVSAALLDSVLSAVRCRPRPAAVHGVHRLRPGRR